MSFLLSLKGKTRPTPRDSQVSFNKPTAAPVRKNVLVVAGQSQQQDHQTKQFARSLNSSKLNSNAHFHNDDDSGQVQVQIQRTHAQYQQQQHRQSSTIANQDQLVTKEQKQDEIVSMDEVMEDLRVLEQQQRESQRLLESTKLTKQHKLQQRSSLESTLSNLKFSNGQARAQLLRVREVLSKSSRELGSAKLRSERSSDNLKVFDEKLKKTIHIVRGLHQKRRKVDMNIVKLQNTDALLSKRKQAMEEKLQITEMKHDDVKRQEELLAKTNAFAKTNLHQLIDDLAKMKQEMTGLEEDLTAAQHMEASTKFRAESIATEIDSEGKRHLEFKINMNKKLEEVVNNISSTEVNIQGLRLDIESKKIDLTKAWERCVEIQKEEGHEPSSSPETAFLDVARIRLSLEEIENQIVQGDVVIEASKERIRSLEDQYEILTKQLAETRDKCKLTLQYVEDENKVQQTRMDTRDAFLSEFITEKEKVAELSVSADNLQKDLLKFREDAIDSKLKKESKLREAQRELEDHLDEMSSILRAHEEEKASLDEVKVRSEKKVAEVKMKVDKAKLNFDTVRNETEEFLNSISVESPHLKKLEEEHEKAINDIKKRVSLIIEQYPCLGTLDLLQNSALVGLQSACDERVNAASESYKDKVRLMKDAFSERMKEEERKRAEQDQKRRVQKEKEVRQKSSKEQSQDKETIRVVELEARRVHEDIEREVQKDFVGRKSLPREKLSPVPLKIQKHIESDTLRDSNDYDLSDSSEDVDERRFKKVKTNIHTSLSPVHRNSESISRSRKKEELTMNDSKLYSSPKDYTYTRREMKSHSVRGRSTTKSYSKVVDTSYGMRSSDADPKKQVVIDRVINDESNQKKLTNKDKKTPSLAPNHKTEKDSKYFQRNQTHENRRPQKLESTQTSSSIPKSKSSRNGDNRSDVDKSNPTSSKILKRVRSDEQSSHTKRWVSSKTSTSVEKSRKIPKLDIFASKIGDDQNYALNKKSVMKTSSNRSSKKGVSFEFGEVRPLEKSEKSHRRSNIKSDSSSMIDSAKSSATNRRRKKAPTGSIKSQTLDTFASNDVDFAFM